MGRHRAEPGRLLGETDPRVTAAVRAMAFVEQSSEVRKPGYRLDWRDCAEVVNAVLEADDAMYRSTIGAMTPLERMQELSEINSWGKRT